MAESVKKKELDEEARKREEAMSQRRQSVLSTEGGYTSVASSLPESESEAERKKKEKKRTRSEGSAESKGRKKIKDGLDSDDDEEEEDEDYDDPLENLKGWIEKLRSWAIQPALGSKISKPQAAKFSRYLNNMQEDIIRAREERARIETRTKERSAMVEIVRKTVQEELEKTKVEVSETPTTSYADSLKKETSKVPPVTGRKGPVTQPPKQVIVRHETKESEEVKATLKRLVKPSELGLKVRRLLNIRNGVIVEAENEEGVVNLMRHEALINAGMKLERPEKRKPVIMIYDVSGDLSDDEVKEEVYEKNMRESQLTVEEMKEEFQIRHRYKDPRSGGKKVHAVVECSGRVRNWLRGKEKIFIEWQCCRVKDYVDVARCYKCQRFGHVAKHCTDKPTCSYCAGEHDFRDCPEKNKKDKVCCANCKRDKKENVKHDAGWRKCPAYEKAVRRQQEKIDYGK